MTPAETVQLCARNNALWCDAVLRAAGARTDFHHGYWQASGKQVPLFPNIVTLTAEHGADLSAALAALPSKAAVKDSFDCLDLSTSGFEKLLTGTWLFRSQEGTRKPASPPDWQKAQTSEALCKWLPAWNKSEKLHTLFPPKLLEFPDIDFVSIRRDDKIQGGAVLNYGPSHAGKDVVGISNIFHRKSWLYGALHALIEPFQHRPVCTYETDTELLPVYRQIGFEDVGTLTVWQKL
ncbi:MAG: hypothetical protein ROO70_13330 [Labrenzia sp.]